MRFEQKGYHLFLVVCVFLVCVIKAVARVYERGCERGLKRKVLG